MATGNTSLLGLALPVQGELTGTWGDVVNQSITELVDSAVAGTTVLSADSDVTLTTTVLAANQARQAILRWTASNGATTRNITAPAQSKPYIVINAGTGSIVLRGAGPTAGITIVAGERCLAAWNGSDFVKIATTASGAAAGSNTQVQFNSSGNLAGSANLTFDGTNLTLGGGTANGVAYLNGSKVLTTGSALVFDGTNLGVGQATPTVKLQVDTASASGDLVGWFRQSTFPVAGIRSGSGYAGFGQSAASSETRIYADGATSFITNYLAGSEQMRLTSTGLGIGTSSPSSKLVVSQGSGAFQAVQIIATNSGEDAGIRLQGGTAKAFRIQQPAASAGLFFYDETNSATRLTIDSSGNLGLGVTPSPWVTLKGFQINTQASVSADGTSIQVGTNSYFGSGGWTYIGTGNATNYYQVNGTHAWRTAASGTAGNAISFTQAMTLDASGNLGVGTTSPVHRLSVKQSGNTSSASYGVTVTNSANDTFVGMGYDATSDTLRVSATYTSTGAYKPLSFWTSDTERARISSAGFFGLGTNNPQAMFDLAGDYKEGVVTANTGTSYTINTATGTVQILTLTGNCTFTFPTAVAGESFTLLLRQDGTGSRTVTWPAAVRWPGGTAPTITATASRQDKYVFTADGTNWYGSNAGQNYTV